MKLLFFSCLTLIDLILLTRHLVLTSSSYLHNTASHGPWRKRQLVHYVDQISYASRLLLHLWRIPHILAQYRSINHKVLSSLLWYACPFWDTRSCTAKWHKENICAVPSFPLSNAKVSPHDHVVMIKLKSVVLTDLWNCGTWW